MLGLLDDVAHHLTSAFSVADAPVWLLGAPVAQAAAALAGSEYLEAEHGLVAGLPSVDLVAERRLQQLVLALNAEGLLLSAHDCSEGGLAVALAESSILGGIGFEGDPAVDIGDRLDAALFGEAQGRIIVSVRPDVFRQGGGAARIGDLARESQVPITRIGKTVAEGTFSFGPIQTTVDEMHDAYEALIRLMER
jgi:phosphoribosylformylglycinamidine synthase subunit PurL